LLKRLKENNKRYQQDKIRRLGCTKANLPESIKKNQPIYHATKMKLLRKIQTAARADPTELWAKIKPLRNALKQTNEADESKVNLRDNADMNELVEKLFPKLERNIPEGLIIAKEPILINDQELETVEKMIRNKRYTGPDDISFKIFNRALEFIPDIIRDIARMSFYTTHIPDHCRLTRGTLIPKKASEKLRVVHVATPMAAYMELIALNRFQHTLEKYNLFNPNQYAFRCGTGRIELVNRIITSIAKHRQAIRSQFGEYASAKHNQTSLIGLDIAGAFDNVGQDIIIEKLYEEIPNEPIRHWIKEFVINRRIRIQYKKLSSYSMEVNKGLPQGSAPGPLLWNYAIEDIHRKIMINTKPIYQNTMILSFADDLTIVAHGIEHSETQALLNQIQQYIEGKGLEINADKSEMITITGPGSVEEGE